MVSVILHTDAHKVKPSPTNATIASPGPGVPSAHQGQARLLFLRDYLSSVPKELARTICLNSTAQHPRISASAICPEIQG